MKDIKTRLIIVCIGLTVISLMLTGQSSAKINPKTAVGIWLFDEGEGDVAKDSSGNGNDGTLMSSPKWVDGKFGKALEFNGNNYVDMGDKDTLDMGTGDLTITSWVNVSSVENVWDHEIAWKGARHWKKGYVLEIAGKLRGGDAGKAEFTFGTGVQGEDDTVLSQSSVADENWHHLAGVIDRKGLVYIYVDGELSSSKPPAAFLDKFNLDNDSPFTIGRHNDGDQYFFGTTDEVAIFNVALTVDDIKNLMENGVGRALGLTPVFPKGKLTTVWGEIKAK
jgi:hypothetical protein